MYNPCEHIILIGMPGSGKSTLAPLLAKSLGYHYYDSDVLITEQTGCSPKQIIESKGEGAFREHEYQAIETLLEKPPAVIATGGGCVVHEATCRILKNHHVIYLQAAIETLHHRLMNSHDRAFFDKTQPESMRPFLAKALCEREPFYQSIASEIISVDIENPEVLAKQWSATHDA